MTDQTDSPTRDPEQQPGDRLNDRQRKFCQILVAGSSATQAYIHSGYSPNGAAQSAERMLRVADIAEYVQHLREEQALRANITMDSHLARLAELAASAALAGQHGAAVQAEHYRGKVAGLYVERREDVTKLPKEERNKRVLSLVDDARKRKSG